MYCNFTYTPTRIQQKYNTLILMKTFIKFRIMSNRLTQIQLFFLKTMLKQKLNFSKKWFFKLKYMVQKLLNCINHQMKFVQLIDKYRLLSHKLRYKAIDYDQVWLALNKGFVNDIYKAMDLMQQLDYTIKLNQSQQGKFIEFLQITCRCKDRDLEKLSQLFPNQYPQSYFKQIEHLTEMLHQYSQMVPLLVQENENLRQEIENTKCNDNDGKSNEISQLRLHLQNIEKQLTETQSQNEYYQQMIKAEEQVRQNKTQLQMLQIDNQDLLFKNNTLQEEIKNYQDQIKTQIESFDRMQMEYKKIIQKKNQYIQELEEKNNLDLTIKNNNQVDLDLIQSKIQQFKSLYEQKIKHLIGTITHLEQENVKLKDLVRSSALEVDSLRLQIEKIIQTNNKKTLKLPKKSQQDYVQLYQKYQEVVEKNEQLSQQLYSQILDGSVLSHI